MPYSPSKVLHQHVAAAVQLLNQWLNGGPGVPIPATGGGRKKEELEAEVNLGIVLLPLLLSLRPRRSLLPGMQRTSLLLVVLL